MQTQIFKRQLRRVIERRDQLTRHRIGFDFARDLDAHTRHRVVATKYNATRLPNGLASCCAKYAAPTNGFGNSGDLISTVPTFEDSGHDCSVGALQADCPKLHAYRPSAPAGFKLTPAGSVTVVFLTVDSASPVGFKLAVLRDMYAHGQPCWGARLLPVRRNLIEGSKPNGCSHPCPARRTVPRAW